MLNNLKLLKSLFNAISDYPLSSRNIKDKTLSETSGSDVLSKLFTCCELSTYFCEHNCGNKLVCQENNFP